MTTADKTRVSISLAKLYGLAARIDYLEDQNAELTIERESLSTMCHTLKTERDAAIAQLDGVMRDRDVARENVQLERKHYNAAFDEYNKAMALYADKVKELGDLKTERDAAIEECETAILERDAARGQLVTVTRESEYALYSEKVKELFETKAALQGATKALDIMREDHVKMAFERDQAIAATKMFQDDVEAACRVRDRYQDEIAALKMLRAAELQKLLAAYKRAGGPPIGDGVDIISRVCAHLDYLHVQATRTAKETNNV